MKVREAEELEISFPLQAYILVEAASTKSSYSIELQFVRGENNVIKDDDFEEGSIQIQNGEDVVYKTVANENER